MANSKILSFTEYIEETTITGPIVGAGPGEVGTGKTGREIFLSAHDFVARHHNVLKSDVRPVFDPKEWVEAEVGTELDGRPRFSINDMLIVQLQWVVDTLSRTGRPKGHWKLQSMYINRDR